MKQAFLLDIPHLDYLPCLDLMRALAEARRKDACPDVVILVEHEPCITLGRRGGPQDLMLPEARLQKQGLAVHQVERGGLATCHGPGQLVVYPVCRLPALGAPQLAHSLEDAFIAVLRELGVEAGRREGFPGVWAAGRKTASLGLASSHGVSIHGLALNNGIDLGLFDLINPCGLGPGSITSLERLRGSPADESRLRELAALHLGRALGVAWRPWTLGQAREFLLLRR